MWARDVEQAVFCVKQHGLPVMAYLDHDLGEQDTVMQFLHWLVNNGYGLTFSYSVISANPEGAKAICAYIDNWKKVHAQEE